MMNTPKTYSEWISLIEEFRNGSGEKVQQTVEVMKNGSLEWQSGVAERFMKHLNEAIDERLQQATQQFQRNFSRSNGSEREILQSLLTLRKELQFLQTAVDLPVLPEDVRQQLIGIMKEQRQQLQQSLEETAKSDRTGKLGSLVRNNRVDEK
ncbi:hypothetical protein ACYSNW_06830 [Enterococcus sp. LJL99]